MSADGCGSEDGALAENGTYIYLCGECKWGKGGGRGQADTFELLCMPSRIVDSKQ